MKPIGNVIDAMIEYYAGDAKRIQHFLKVYGFAKVIGELENIPKDQQEIIEVAAAVHDIGIKLSEEKYHSSAGNYQELEGPPVAERLLRQLGYEKALIDRVCYLVAHHHTYSNIDAIDYQILIEADFLVNISEDNMAVDAVEKVKTKIFKTAAGISFLTRIYQQ
jgi:HD superfamily phosphodiesterase